ncbi:LeuA family protein [Xenorhabdus poinarii]|uniref:LeuA family protein n=1 Tax=Xenorhabdus poinarii TaxID=40577 RepID=UPI000A950050|nr:LeuA family protein [Xenorhabdus poinarii]
MIRIIDCTLREGMQTRQCCFTAEQSALLSRKIAALGVDTVECGHSFISSKEAERVRGVVAASPVPVLAHARARKEDIDAVLQTGAHWIGLFASINEISMATKFKGKRHEELLTMFGSSIRYAREQGLLVRATIEDAGRTAAPDLVSMIMTAREAGAERICFADSVGILLPDETFDVLSLLHHEFPDVLFEYHVHNDRGLALANTLKAIEAGVKWVSTSCNGIGERTGITDTFQLITLLATRFDQNRFDISQILALSELVEAYSRIPMSPMQPVVGKNAFVHVARLHQLAMQKDSAAYSIFDPKLIKGDISLEQFTPLQDQDLFLTPFEKSSTELKYHRHGPGKRFVMLDKRLVDGSLPVSFLCWELMSLQNSAMLTAISIIVTPYFYFWGTGRIMSAWKSK